ncbi:hypothetical protein F5X99DRAFT_410401 [Biscogniauxia marginata]|nr:hypothetical protein F5X99DRAFT_410401 [Biscogniauxia marginata]
MLSTLLLLLPAVLQHVTAMPTLESNVTLSTDKAVDGSMDVDNSTLVLGNDLYHILDAGANHKGPWQYNDLECRWSENWMPGISTECTEWCDIDDRNKRLRYHIMISGNGQDPDIWCQNFKMRMKFNCGVHDPDFWNCNGGSRAPEMESLRSWAIDGWAHKAVQVRGVNLRFDFGSGWNPRDAQHDCVRTAIKESTCAGAVWYNGNRCIPVNYVADDNADPQDESFVPPEGCHHSWEVPEHAR